MAEITDLFRQPSIRSRKLKTALKSDTARRTGVSFIITLALAALMAGVAAISYYVLSPQSLRLDEAQSLWQTNRSIPQMLNIVGKDVHVPLYHLMLNIWQVFFGNAVEVGRYFSLIFFMLTIPATYLLGRQIFSRSISFFGAFLLAISPFMNWYGNEIRMYSLLTFITVLNQYFFLRIFKRRGNLSWFGYAVTILIGIYIHYFFWLVPITQALFYLVYRRQFLPGSFKKFLGVGVLAMLAIVPWLLYIYRLGLANETRPQLAPPSTVDVFNTFSQFIFGFQNDYINTFIVSLWPLLVLLSFVYLQRQHKRPPEVNYFFMAATLPVLAAFVGSLILSPFYLSRYLIIAVPALYLLIAWLFSQYTRGISRALSVALVAGMILTFGIQTTSATTPVKEDYRAAAQYLDEKAGSQDVVILSPAFTIYPFEYYYKGSALVETLPRWNRFEAGTPPAFNEGVLPEQTRVIHDKHETAWLVLSFDQGNNETIRRYYDENFERLDKVMFSPDLVLYKYQLRYNIPDTEKLIESFNKP